MAAAMVAAANSLDTMEGVPSASVGIQGDGAMSGSLLRRGPALMARWRGTANDDAAAVADSGRDVAGRVASSLRRSHAMVAVVVGVAVVVTAAAAPPRGPPPSSMLWAVAETWMVAGWARPPAMWCAGRAGSDMDSAPACGVRLAGRPDPRCEARDVRPDAGSHGRVAAVAPVALPAMARPIAGAPPPPPRRSSDGSIEAVGKKKPPLANVAAGVAGADRAGCSRRRPTLAGRPPNDALDATDGMGCGTAYGETMGDMMA